MMIRWIGVAIGVTLAANLLDMAWQAYQAPPPQASLSSAVGTVGEVRPCTTGRGRIFRYTVRAEAASSAPIQFKMACPSSVYTALRESVGQPVRILYLRERGFLFESTYRVYDITLAGQPVLVYAHEAYHADQVRPYVVMLRLAAAACGIGCVFLGLKRADATRA